MLCHTFNQKNCKADIGGSRCRFMASGGNKVKSLSVAFLHAPSLHAAVRMMDWASVVRGLEEQRLDDKSRNEDI